MAKGIFCIFIITLTAFGAISSWAGGTPVTVEAISHGTVVITEEAMGWIETKVNPEVSAEVSGRIKQVFVNTGQVVKAGSQLLRIDNEQQKLEKTALQSDVARLDALIVNQHKSLERHRNLLAKKSISQERFDNAELKLATLKEQFAAAQARLADNKRRMAKTTVSAPVGGYIEKKFVSTGDFVKEGSPLFLMITDKFLRIVLPFPEIVASNLVIGQTVKLTSPLSRDRIITAKINQIRPAVNIHSRAIEVIIYLENPGSWRPGGTINGIVIIDQHENSLLVPTRSIVRRPAGKVVYQIENNIAHQRKVIVGKRQGDLVEIISGLSGHERIIVDGAGFLTDGAPVMEKQ